MFSLHNPKVVRTCVGREYFQPQINRHRRRHSVINNFSTGFTVLDLEIKFRIGLLGSPSDFQFDHESDVRYASLHLDQKASQ